MGCNVSRPVKEVGGAWSSPKRAIRLSTPATGCDHGDPDNDCGHQPPRHGQFRENQANQRWCFDTSTTTPDRHRWPRLFGQSAPGLHAWQQMYCHAANDWLASISRSGCSWKWATSHIVGAIRLYYDSFTSAGTRPSHPARGPQPVPLPVATQGDIPDRSSHDGFLHLCVRADDAQAHATAICSSAWYPHSGASLRFADNIRKGCGLRTSSPVRPPGNSCRAFAGRPATPTPVGQKLAAG
jgi:hypothetical protein